jgi:S-adenosyl-L-methionine hydrolase (adenosine-forming)
MYLLSMIVLLTDFQSSDALGVVKGVMKSVSPKAEFVDLCNNIAPFKIRSGAWILLYDYKYFPTGTVFYCVVDPSVGTERKSIAVKTTHYYFVGPDNGLMFPAATADQIERVTELDTSTASKTFHGRDVFAPAAARLDKGDEITQLGKAIPFMQQLSITSNSREGEIVFIEHFGNMITNIKPLKGKDSYELSCRQVRKQVKCYDTFGNAPENELFVVKGSRDTLEIALRESSAAAILKAKVGDVVTLR